MNFKLKITNSIIAHTLVKNEARFLWYSVSSVVDHVDKILLWDTGSTDGSLEIEKEIEKRWPEKIELKNFSVQKFDEEAIRQQMLDETSSDWFIVVDADEIWWEDSIKKVTDLIKEKGNELESIVVPTINPVGDIFHRQEEQAGKYHIAGKVGHYNLRAVKRSIPGLHVEGPHGKMTFADENGISIQDRDANKIAFLDAPYLHTTYLQRAKGNLDKEVVKRIKKRKYEIGLSLPKDFYYPEVLFMPRPESVVSPWRRMGLGFKIRAAIETPLRKIKRRLWHGGVGY